MELECRQEEDENAVGIDLDKASKKSMAKVVNQVSGIPTHTQNERRALCS